MVSGYKGLDLYIWFSLFFSLQIVFSRCTDITCCTGVGNLEDQLGPEGLQAMEAAGIADSHLVHVASQSYTLQCNWKVFCDNYLVRCVYWAACIKRVKMCFAILAPCLPDIIRLMHALQDGGYHVSVAHPDLAAGLDLTTYSSTIYESCSIQSCQPKNAAEVRLGTIP